MKNFSKIKITTLILLAFTLLTTGFQCTWITPSQQQLLEPIEITWWGVFDDPENFAQVISDYKVQHPNVTITYRKLRPEEFETELLNALAEDRGPDIFSIHNDWIGKYLPKIEPLPAKTKMAYSITQKSLGVKEETITEIRETASITPTQLRNTFLDVVYDDVVKDGKIYGLPLSLDTLALFYNRDLLNNAGIPLPPANWLTLQDNVKKLTYQDQNNKLIQSGIALGTGNNVDRATDILSLLMMQNGAEMISEGKVAFGTIPKGFTDRTYNPGPEAVRFYTDFADPTKEVYTWDENFPNSLDAFAQGQVAMIFSYNYNVPYLLAKRQGKLNYGIAKVPQIEGRPEINFANYWLQTVSNKSKHKNEAWDFLQFIASKPAEAKKYLDKTARPTALRALIDGQLTNDDLKIFVDQLLTAKSWYQGKDANAMENAFKEMINSVRSGSSLNDTIGIAVQKIQQTL